MEGGVASPVWIPVFVPGNLYLLPSLCYSRSSSSPTAVGGGVEIPESGESGELVLVGAFPLPLFLSLSPTHSCTLCAGEIDAFNDSIRDRNLITKISSSCRVISSGISIYFVGGNN